MARLLIIEGNTQASRDKADQLNLRYASSIYRQAIEAHFTDVHIDILIGTDPGHSLPKGARFEDYDGLVMGGSGLHAYGNEFAVTNQIELMRQAGESGIPF